MLHITNGDSAAVVMAQSGMGGAILPWRDVLHEGPVPAGLPLDELSRVRAHYLAHAELNALHVLQQDFARRDATLAAYARHEEVVLWFEHDLYDQLQLIQLLDYLAQQNSSATRLSLVCDAAYLGNASPQRLRELFAARRQVTARQLEVGRAAWRSFRSPDPTDIEAFLAEDTASLPFLAAALERHLEQFPSTVNGLARSEAQALAAVADGQTTTGRAFAAAQACEPAKFLGDAIFALYLQGLSCGPHPLLLWADKSVITAPSAPQGHEAFWDRPMVLTTEGRAVLSGQRDRIELNGIERWLGGVHLSGDAPWRWDPAARQLRRTGV